MTSDKKKPAAWRATNPVTRHSAPVAFSLAAVLLLVAVSAGRAQPSTLASANDFASVEYYGSPNPQQVKTRLSGAAARPLTGGLLEVTQLKLETFATNGRPEMIITAPECVYDQMNGLASSPGRLQLQRGDGKIRIEGEGFLWRQNDSFLTISNDVRTVIVNTSGNKIAP